MEDDFIKKLVIFYLFVTSCISIAYFGMQSSGVYSPFWGLISSTAHFLWFTPLVIILLAASFWIGSSFFQHENKKPGDQKVVVSTDLKNDYEGIEKDKKTKEEENLKHQIILNKRLLENARSSNEVTQDALEDFL